MLKEFNFNLNFNKNSPQAQKNLKILTTKKIALNKQDKMFTTLFWG